MVHSVSRDVHSDFVSYSCPLFSRPFRVRSSPCASRCKKCGRRQDYGTISSCDATRAASSQMRWGSTEPSSRRAKAVSSQHISASVDDHSAALAAEASSSLQPASSELVATTRPSRNASARRRSAGSVRISDRPLPGTCLPHSRASAFCRRELGAHRCGTDGCHGPELRP